MIEREYRNNRYSLCIILLIIYLHLLTENSQRIKNTIKYSVATDSITYRDYDEDNYLYYPWNDGNDYHGICLSIQNQLLTSKGGLLIHWGKGGGLGHKLVSLLRSITYSLANNRPLRIIMPESFWFSTSSCFKKLKYRDDIRYYRRCTGRNTCYSKSNNSFVLPNETLEENVKE